MPMASPRYHAADLLLRGLSPTQISREMHIPLGVVMSYLYRLVGEGKLRRSDILFAIPRDVRQQIENIVQEHKVTQLSRIRRWLHSAGKDVDAADLQIYLKLRDARVALGDMYELIRDLELSMHKFVRDSLVREFKENWWREGVPLRVREDCALMNERDAEPAADPFCYTTVLHLLHTFDQNWSTIGPLLPPKLRSNKQEFLTRLRKLNSIRNMVMHPVKGYTITEEDFSFVREFHSDFARALAAAPPVPETPPAPQTPPVPEPAAEAA